MTFYLKDKDGDVIIDCEYWVKTEDGHEFLEISSGINVIPYSKLLISETEKEDPEVTVLAHLIDDLSELRGWLWEVYFMTKKNTPEYYDDVLKELKEKFNAVAMALNLSWNTD